MQMRRFTQDTLIANIGSIELSPFRRLRMTLRDEKVNGLVPNMKVQTAADGGWTTGGPSRCGRRDRT